MIEKIISRTIQLICVVFVVLAFQNFSMGLPVAVHIEENNVVLTEIKNDLKKLNAEKNKIPDLANAVYIAHESTGLNPKLITALMKTESRFRVDAIGPPNKTNIRYKGLMQTPTATLMFSDVDVLHGARILKQKLEYSNNDLRIALACYKGGKNPVAFRQADEVLKLYAKLVL